MTDAGHDHDVTTRPWLVPLIALVAATGLFIAGVVTWRMMSPDFLSWPTHRSLAPGRPPYRLHPLRAELLWAASGFVALAALGLGVWQWRRRAAGHVGPGNAATIRAR